MSNTQIDEMFNAIYDGDCEKIDALIDAGLSVNTTVDVDQWNFFAHGIGIGRDSF